MTARVRGFLAALAASLAARLGFPLFPLAEAGPAVPVAVPLCAGGASWLPLRPLGLPGSYNPTQGGAP